MIMLVASAGHPRPVATDGQRTALSGIRQTAKQGVRKLSDIRQRPEGRCRISDKGREEEGCRISDRCCGKGWLSDIRHLHLRQQDRPGFSGPINLWINFCQMLSASGLFFAPPVWVFLLWIGVAVAAAIAAILLMAADDEWS